MTAALLVGLSLVLLSVLGTAVSAWCGEVSSKLTSTVGASGESWYFNRDIPGDAPETPRVKEGCTPNEIVSFKIDGSWATEKVQWVSQRFWKSQLDWVFGYDPATSNMVAVGIPLRSHPPGQRALLRCRRALLRDGGVLVWQNYSYRKLC